MSEKMRVSAILFVALCMPVQGIAGELDEISNYREYSPAFASSGQPTKAQLSVLSDNGFQRIVYIAFTNSGKAYPDEDQLVKKLGMNYVQIPVDWEQPSKSDFYAFAGAMETGPSLKTLVHCQVNYRASAFSFLYRVIFQGVAVSEAKKDMNSIWQPNETWTAYLLGILRDNNIDPYCDGCDWSAGEAH